MRRNINVLSILYIVCMFFMTACSGSSGGGQADKTASSANSRSPITSGTYTLTLDPGIVLCADGTQYPQGFSFSADLTMDFPLFSLFISGAKIGAGYVDSDGAFHANASYSIAGMSFDIILDGQADKSQITGDAQAAVTPPLGSQCTLNTRFTAMQGGGA